LAQGGIKNATKSHNLGEFVRTPCSLNLGFIEYFTGTNKLFTYFTSKKINVPKDISDAKNCSGNPKN